MVAVINFRFSLVFHHHLGFYFASSVWYCNSNFQNGCRFRSHDWRGHAPLVPGRCSHWRRIVAHFTWYVEFEEMAIVFISVLIKHVSVFRRLRHRRCCSFLCRFDAFDFHVRRHFGNDGSNSTHNSRHDCRFGGQCHFNSPPTVSLRFNHHDQETSLFARHYLVQQWYVTLKTNKTSHQLLKCNQFSISTAAYNIFVEDFMVGNIKYIYNGMSYKELKNNIRESRRVRAFPLVDNPSKCINSSI